MRVLKFGGTSIGDAESICRVCRIIDSRSEESVVLVFSAIGDTTDRLENIGALAADRCSETSLKKVAELREHHLELLDEVCSDQRRRAEAVEIWTDVDGIMTADPQLVPDARCVPVMSLEEAAAIASFGARVLHPGTLVPAIGSDRRAREVWRGLRDPGPGRGGFGRRPARGKPRGSSAGYSRPWAMSRSRWHRSGDQIQPSASGTTFSP